MDEKFFDATDALAIAMCHYCQLTNPLSSTKASTNWLKFIQANPDRIRQAPDIVKKSSKRIKPGKD
jgi:crossover junction endodeoxyribonuclease RuvC